MEKENMENLSRRMESFNGGLTISSAVCGGSEAASGGSTRFPTWHGQVGLQNISRRASEWEDIVTSLPWEDMRDVLEIMTQTDKDRRLTCYRLLTRPPSLYE